MYDWGRWRQLYNLALSTNSDADWATVDQAMIEIAKKSTRSIQAIHELADHAIRRLGLEHIRGELPGDPVDVWQDHILFVIRRCTERVHGLHFGSMAPPIIHSIDTSRKLIAVSDAWCALLGYDADEVIGTSCVDYLTDESARMAIERNLPQFWRAGSIHQAQYDMVNKKGGIVPVSLSAIAERDATGNIVRAIAVLRKR